METPSEPERAAEPDLVSRAGGLPLDAVLVRTGGSRPGDMANAAWICAQPQKMGVYGLTFWSWPRMPAEGIVGRVRAQAQVAGRRNPVLHGAMREVVVEELLASNPAFYLVKTGPSGHYTLRLPIEDDEEWETPELLLDSDHGHLFSDIDSTLSEAVHNPARGQFE